MPTRPPLNVFQRLIRQWDSIHPYNAAQVMLLTGPCEPDRLDTAWRQTLADLAVGPTPVLVHRHLDEAPFPAAAPGAPHVRAIETPDPATVSLESHLSSEL